jgi:pyroglutamyl-peptidase
MKKRLLLTSFDIWLPHHRSNSSDDLLVEVAKISGLLHDLTFLRQLPVDVALASYRTIEKINELQPDGIICCGMAESRKHLSVESQARITTKSTDCNIKVLAVDSQESVLQATINIQELLVGAKAVEISHDCGKFVCEGLYYSVLDYLYQQRLTSRCIFVHVPVLNAKNLAEILADFVLIIHRLALL